MDHTAGKVNASQNPAFKPANRSLLTTTRLGDETRSLLTPKRVTVEDFSMPRMKGSFRPSLVRNTLNSRNQAKPPGIQFFKQPRLDRDVSRIPVNGETHVEDRNNLAGGSANSSTMESNQGAGGSGSGSGSGSAVPPRSATPPVVPPGTGTGGGGAPAPLATVTVGNVAFLGSTDRIAPTQSTTVPVTVSGLAAGSSVAMDVEGSGGVNGTATISAGATLTSTGTVTVLGGTQTTPSNAGSLRIRARVGGTVVGRSPGFTVAAWPTNFTISRYADVFSPIELGVDVNISCVSDGSGALSELSEAEHSEQVDLESRDNPPWTIIGAVTGGVAGGTSHFMPATSTGLVDRHHKGRAAIDLSTIGAGVYSVIYRQNFIFNDRRTGVTDRVVRNSGFRIRHTIVILPVGLVTARAQQSFKAGAAVTAVGRAATAGAGSATSDLHML